MTEERKLLRLLDDAPAGPERDKFKHRVYSSILRDIFCDNQRGIAVALFGKWGKGKSSIVDMLGQELPNNRKLIVFNAWKARGDSIRRQLVLHLLEQVKSPNVQKYMRFTQTLTPLEWRTPEEVKLIDQDARDSFLTQKQRPPTIVRLATIIACVCVALVILSLMGASKGAIPVDWASLLNTALIAVGGVAFARVIRWWQAQNRVLLAYSEPVSDSQKFRYPEQFEKIFRDEVAAYHKRESRELVVVVDDLDRCDPDTVVEALAAIRQFSGDRSLCCQFLIPCDERQVVFALEASGHDAGATGARYHDYHSEELLRKFFDVVVRLDEMLPDDLSDYAAILAEEVGLSKMEARELVDIAAAHDPREVKKLLNALRISHESIDRRAGTLLPQKDQMEELPATEMLLVALRETVPEFYGRLCSDLSLLTDLSGNIEQDERSNTNSDERKHAPEDEKAIAIIRRAGAVSEVTATELIYGRLDPELRHIPVSGLLMNVFLNADERRFVEVMLSIRAEDQADIQAWLKKKIQRAHSDASLRDMFQLFLSVAESKDAKDPMLIVPSVAALFVESPSLSAVFSGFKRYQALELIWPHLPQQATVNVIIAVFSNFEKDRAKADNELAFLLEHAKELDNDTASELRAWMVEEANQESEDEAFIQRLHKNLREKPIRETCHGFAPEVAVLIAGKSEWLDDPGEDLSDDSEKWPRYNVVITLVGDSEEHAARCLAAIFTGKGQLASPLALTGSALGFDSAWKTVSHLLTIVTDNQIQDVFIHIRNWLNHQSQPFGFESILHDVGYDAFRLSADQISELSKFLAKRLQARPEETYIIDFIDKAPDDEHLKKGWRSLVSEFTGAYFTWLEAQPVLSQPIINVFEQIQKYHWPISEQAEKLLIMKLQAAKVTTFTPWLNALAPLVANRRTNTRDVVKNCIERNQRVEQAFAAGTRVLWKNEIDAEAAAMLGRFFITRQSEIPQYNEEWEKLKEKTGAGAVLETMQDSLPSELENLVSYRNALNMIIGGFDKIDKKHKEALIDNRLLPLVISEDSMARQMGMETASQLPSSSKTMQKQMNELRKNEELTEDQRKLVGEILNKEVL